MGDLRSGVVVVVVVVDGEVEAMAGLEVVDRSSMLVRVDSSCQAQRWTRGNFRKGVRCEREMCGSGRRRFERIGRIRALIGGAGGGNREGRTSNHPIDLHQLEGSVTTACDCKLRCEGWATVKAVRGRLATTERLKGGIQAYKISCRYTLPCLGGASEIRSRVR